ncbi:hypothetical protein IFVP182_C2120307 [Vibrio parahaemolyticus]
MSIHLATEAMKQLSIVRLATFKYRSNPNANVNHGRKHLIFEQYIKVLKRTQKTPSDVFVHKLSNPIYGITHLLWL